MNESESKEQEEMELVSAMETAMSESVIEDKKKEKSMISMRALIRHQNAAAAGLRARREQALSSATLKQVIKKKSRLDKLPRKDMANVGHSIITGLVYQKAIKYGSLSGHQCW